MNITRLRRQILLALACAQTLTFFILTSQSNYETPEIVAIGRHTSSINDEQSQEDLDVVAEDKRSSSSTRDIVMDLLKTTENNGERSNAIRTLAELVANMDDNSIGKDGVAEADESNEARRRMERLVRVVDSAKYELEAMLRRKKMEPAVAALRQIVNESKQRNSSPGDLKQQLSAVRLNLYDVPDDGTLPAWVKFQNNINAVEMYSDTDGIVDKLLEDLKKQPISKLKAMGRRSGTQLHFMYKLDDDGRALFKPQRLARDYERPVDIELYYDVERHTAEIAAFHLDRVLGFRRVPPTVGRKVHIINEVYSLDTGNATGGIYESQGHHICFNGVCEANCDDKFPVCADDKLFVEGSMIAVFPIKYTAEFANPFYLTCTNCSTSAEVRQHDDNLGKGSNFCSANVRQMAPFNNDRVMLNFVDAHIFDFFTGNLDRHDVYNFENLGNDSFFAMFDNGKGFGTADRDEIKLLAPLYQCCMVRQSTVDRLLALFTGPERLSDVMRRSLETDSLQPVLTEAHLAALDRRLAIILEEIYECTQRNPQQTVVIDDGL